MVKAVFVSNLIIHISELLKWRLGARLALDIGSFLFDSVFLFLYFDKYTLSVKVLSASIFASDNSRHYDKTSSLLTNEIFTDKIFQYSIFIVLILLRYEKYFYSLLCSCLCLHRYLT